MRRGGRTQVQARNCRIYKDKTTILTLCSVCRSGFHLQCKNFRFINKDENQNDSEQTLSESMSSIKKIEQMLSEMYINSGNATRVPANDFLTFNPYQMSTPNLSKSGFQNLPGPYGFYYPSPPQKEYTE